MISAPVQADRTGDAIRAILSDIRAFPAKKPVTAEELTRVTEGNIRALPNRFESNSDVLGAILANELLDRPDDYYATLANRYRTVSASAIEAAARAYLKPDGLTFVVVGDRKLVAPQLKRLGLPVVFAAAPAR